mgnify:CR=1 FL=1
MQWVMHIYNDILKLNNFSKFDLDTEVLAEIESVWALLETDIIYWNNEFEKLNESLNNLNFTGWFNNL